ncbi:MAG: trypsin-like peptidase domain-containing protein [Candidatus Hydrogenedentes bacterium]|nr:trypsin-like peptidase domain-containing protein [Candidatus Hydrogenedentota bacterium]
MILQSKVSFITLAAFLALSAAGQESIDQSRRTAIVTAIEKVSPAVVSVNVIELRAQRQLPPRLRDFWDMFDLPGPYTVQQRRLNSVGSGFFYREGYIITNYHVVEEADQVASVTLPDGRELEVALVGIDERTDIAVLRASGANLPPVSLGNSDDLLTGEWAIAIGNPFGPLMSDSQPTVSVGVVSANHRRISPRVGGGERLYQGMIQTDAAINPGNSGGPLVNSRGQVIGINTMIFSESGGSVGLGFAIPINRAKRVAEEIIQYGRRRDPWAGFKVEDVANLTQGIISQLGIQSHAGCVIQNILKDCPAYAAGLRPGDVVIGVNGQRVETSSDIDFAVWDLFVGDPITVTAERSGQVSEFKFVIQELAK